MSTAESVLLAYTANYRQVLELRPCEAVPPLVEVRISTWYAGAKDRESPQVRFQTVATPEALSGLKNALEAVLACRGACPEQEGR